MKRRSTAGWSRSPKPMVGALAVVAVLLAALGWAKLRPGADARPPEAKLAAASVPTNDTAAETWRVVPPPAPPPAAPRAESRAIPQAHREPVKRATETDWGNLSVGLADEPVGNAISLGAPAELESGLSASERDQLIAADQDQRIRPSRPGRGRGTVVVGRGTPRGGGRGRCD